MSENTSKQQLEVPPAQAFHHELHTAKNSAAFLLLKLRSMKGSGGGLHLLDVSAGSGTITATLTKLVSEGQVTAIDINPKILPRARANAETAGVKNIEFQDGDVRKLTFADATFDITFCHQVLTHIASPWDALREMLRVTKPGRLAAAREGDYETESVWPEPTGLIKFHKFIAESFKPNGGTATASRQLLPWALKAGARRDQITLTFSTWAYHSPSEKRIWGAPLSSNTG